MTNSYNTTITPKIKTVHKVHVPRREFYQILLSLLTLLGITLFLTLSIVVAYSNHDQDVRQEQQQINAASQSVQRSFRTE